MRMYKNVDEWNSGRMRDELKNKKWKIIRCGYVLKCGILSFRAEYLLNLCMKTAEYVAHIAYLHWIRGVMYASYLVLNLYDYPQFSLLWFRICIIKPEQYSLSVWFDILLCVRMSVCMQKYALMSAILSTESRRTSIEAIISVQCMDYIVATGETRFLI